MDLDLACPACGRRFDSAVSLAAHVVRSEQRAGDFLRERFTLHAAAGGRRAMESECAWRCWCGSTFTGKPVDVVAQIAEHLFEAAIRDTLDGHYLLGLLAD